MLSTSGFVVATGEAEAKESRWCECGEHYVPREMMWPNFADCRECVTPKEYAEQMGVAAA